MSAGQQVRRVRESVTEQFALVLASEAFTGWAQSETIRSDDLVICNNSFLFREGSTTKSDKYLAVKANEVGALTAPPYVISPPTGINLQFKHVSSQAPGYVITDLDSAIGEQLPHLGQIVFSLAGRIGDVEPGEVGVAGVSGVDVLRYAPDQSNTAEFADGVISLKRLDDLGSAWSAVKTDLGENDFVGRDAFAEAFESAFHALEEKVGRSVDPGDVSDAVPSILSSVLERMEGQSAAYAVALQQHRERPQDTEVYNELLRLAYNFADGTLAVLGLMVGICDLKPIIFWLTVAEQVELAHRFTRLPFSLVGKGKPSLGRYRSVIANARNQAFHDVFAFDHPFDVRLPEGALGAPELRLFREYNKRGGPSLTFEDRELVEILASLTRTPERRVPLGFWDRNEEVMAAVVEVVRGLRRALVVAAS